MLALNPKRLSCLSLIFCFTAKHCQEGEVFLTVGGKSYVGEAAAWRSLCILPQNIGRFKAVPFPAWAQPDNVIIFVDCVFWHATGVPPFQGSALTRAVAPS